MSFRPIFSALMILALWRLAPLAFAQSPDSLSGSVSFNTPAEAAQALGKADTLAARVDLLGPVAAAYLRAHAYEALPAMMAGLPVPENAEWQRTFLLANLQQAVGNKEEAMRLLRQLPAIGLSDPIVLKFRVQHLDLFQDAPTPPGLDPAALTQSAKSHLDAMEPDQAWEILAAHAEDFLDHLDALHPLTMQIFDQNLAPRLIPLLEERAKRQPENWELRLTLALSQLAAGDTTGATESFRQIYAQQPDSSPLSAPTPAERVAAMQQLGPNNGSWRDGALVFSRVKTLENARDLALMNLAALADQRREGAKFIHDLEEECRHDGIRWITSLMLIDSRGLVLRELRAALTKGLPPGLGAVAVPWLSATRFRTGPAWVQEEHSRLAQAFAALPKAPGSTVPPADNSAWPEGITRLAEMAKSDDAAAKEKFLAEFNASVDSQRRSRALSVFLYQMAKTPDNDFLAQGAAILLAKAAADADEWIALRALEYPWPWAAPRRRIVNRMERDSITLPRASRRMPDDLPANEQVEAALLEQSASLRLMFGLQAAQFSQNPPPLLVAALEKLASHASSPLCVSARIAEAYVLHEVAGQEDRALDLLRQTIKESPSYVARFWLTAFLARRQQYQEAAGVFASIQSMPGYFENFLQNGRTLLQRADKGEAPFKNERAAMAAPAWAAAPRKGMGFTYLLLPELQRLTGAEPADPAAAAQALAIAAKLAAIFPAEAVFPGREDVLKAFAKFGGLDGQIAQMEERAKQFPHSADAQLALGIAWALSPQPQAIEKSTAAYREAFRLAPNRADVAKKMLSPLFSFRERQDAYCVLLRQNAVDAQDRQAAGFALFGEPDDILRYAKAYTEGLRRESRNLISDDPSFRTLCNALRGAGQDDTLIDLLTAINRTVPPNPQFRAEPEKLLLGLLEEKGRAAEVAPVVDRMLFPSEYLYGLDLAEYQPPLLNPPTVLDFVRKVKTPERMATFKERARRIMAEHPGGARAPLVLLTLLILDHDPAGRAAMPACLEAFRANQDDRLGEDLSTLAQMASTAPETKTAALDLLAEACRWQAGKPRELAALQLLAAMALDVGERERAEEALRELLQTVKAQTQPLNLQEWAQSLELVARAGMAAEAAEMMGLLYAQAKNNPRRDQGALSPGVLAYVTTCLRCGQPEIGRGALADFQRVLATDLANAGSAPERVQYSFNQRFLTQMVEAFVLLDQADEAAKALRTLRESSVAAAAPELRKRIEKAKRMLDQGTGELGGLPVAFVEGGQGNEMRLWWDVSALSAQSDSRSRAEVSVLGADRKALTGRYSVEILGGDTPSHLTRLAVIPNAPSWGEWRGTPKNAPASIRFTRVILTDAEGASVIGPSVPTTPGEERLGDPDLGEAVKAAGADSTPWTLPEGALSSIPGPIPGRPALAFVYKGTQSGGEISGARIPVQPGESFGQSAWLRGGEGCRWGVRCFDAQSKELASPSGGDLSVSDESPGWTFVEQRLESVKEPSGNAGSRVSTPLPPGTAFIQPVLKLNSNRTAWDTKAPACWAGLSLRSLPLVERKPETPEINPDQLGSLGTPSAADRENAARSESVFAEFAQPACKIAVSPESDMIVVGCKDGTLHFLAYPSGKEIASVHAHADPIIDLCVLPGQAGVYSVDARGDTHFVSLQPAKDELAACTAHLPRAVVISPARRWIVFLSIEVTDAPYPNKARLEVVDLTTGKLVRLLEQDGEFPELSLSSDEKRLSVRPTQGRRQYEADSWELPSFNKLPDRTHLDGQHWVGGPQAPLFSADPLRNRYVMVENNGRFVVRTMDNALLWSFDPAPKAASLAVLPKDGVIFLCKADGKVWRCVSPK